MRNHSLICENVLKFKIKDEFWFVIKPLRNIENLEGIRVYQTRWIKSGSGICLPGIGIFIHSGIPDNAKLRIIQHEFGHYLDYRFGVDGDRKMFIGSYFLGFYVKIGIPSILNLVAGINRIPAFSGEHRKFWTEIRANRLAKAHFGESLAEDFSRFFPFVWIIKKFFIGLSLCAINYSTFDRTNPIDEKAGFLWTSILQLDSWGFFDLHLSADSGLQSRRTRIGVPESGFYSWTTPKGYLSHRFFTFGFWNWNRRTFFRLTIQLY